MKLKPLLFYVFHGTIFLQNNTPMLVSTWRNAKWFRGSLWAAAFSLIGFFVTSGVAQAALTTPTTIVSGAQYAEAATPYENFGWEREIAPFSFSDNVYAWRPERQERTKMLYMEPEPGVEAFFVAYVNDDDSACTVIDASHKLCRIEFKMSRDKGVTWSRAIESATQYLPVLLVNTGSRLRLDYTVTQSWDRSSIWVAYTGDTAGNGSVHVQKLTWNPSTKQWVMGAASTHNHVPYAASVRPWPQLGNCPGNSTYEGAATTSVLAQKYGAGERLWVVMDFHTSCADGYTFLFYTDNFTTANPTWQLSNMGKSLTDTNSDGVPDYGLVSGDDPWAFWKRYNWPLSGDAQTILVPTGTDASPAIVRVVGREFSVDVVNCYQSLPYILGMQVSVMADKANANSWIPYTVKNVEPAIWLDACSPTSGAPNIGALSFSFSAAALPTGTDSSRLVIAYEGGHDNTSTTYAQDQAHQNHVRVMSIPLIIGQQANSVAHATFGASPYIGASTYAAPVVGFHGNSAYLAMRDLSTNRLAIFKEDQVPPASYTWSTTAVFDDSTGVTGQAYSPIMPPVTSGAVTLNSGLPPVAWERVGAQALAFTANSGGNVYGYGWSSNFGWLSMNCANAKSTDACAPPGSSPYGTSLAVAPVNSPPTVNFSPTPTDMTYAASGFGWSSNAGFLSFNRLHSAYDCGAVGNCGDADPLTDDNNYGNPPGQAYRNSVLTSDPTLKYDKTSQRLNGWGRFLNLCNYQDIGGGTYRCRDAEGGWVRFQGYWRDSTKTSTLRRAYASGNSQLPVVDASTFPDPVVTGKNEIGIIGEEYFYYSSIGTDIFGEPVLNLVTNDILRNYSIGTPVYAAGGDYGVNAYYSGNGYLLSGWAWSGEYGWIRFNPLIFLGYAWLETLFGNIYVNGGGADAGNFQLPDAQRLTGERLTSCGRDLDGDGDGDEACYVSTYRIETNGTLQPLAHPSGQSVSPGSSASIDFLQNLLAGDSACGFDGNYTDCSRSLGTTAPELFGRDSASAPNTFGFPSVQTSTATYRNALGKLDVGGLTKDVTGLAPYNDILGTKDYQRSTNRFGQKIFVTTKNGTTPVDWTVNELAGQFAYTPPGGGGSPPDIPLDAIENQVVHIQGDLTIGHDPNEANIAASTLTVAVSGQRAAINGAGGTLTLASAANFPTPSATYPLSGTVILGTGSGKEEYLSYTGKSGNQLTGVRTISGNPYTASDHPLGTTIRWVWRMPYTVGQTLPRNITFVVDGDLKIHYNIIASDPTKDLDLAAVTPASIRDSMAAAFIVRGNVSIAKEVNRITGAFIVIGRDSSKDPDLNADTPSAACTASEYGFDGCGGAFDTGNDADAAFCGGTDKKCNPLTIEGLLFARKFNFTRTGALDTIDEPAEQVTFDQRLFLNPPPGLEDVTKALPNPTRELP